MLITIIIIWWIFCDDDFDRQANYIDSTDCKMGYSWFKPDSHHSLHFLAGKLHWQREHSLLSIVFPLCNMQCTQLYLCKMGNVKWAFSCRQTTLTAQTQIVRHRFRTLQYACSYTILIKFSCRQTTSTARTQIVRHLFRTSSRPGLNRATLSVNSCLTSSVSHHYPQNHHHHHHLGDFHHHRVALDWAEQHWMRTHVWLLQ